MSHDLHSQLGDFAAFAEKVKRGGTITDEDVNEFVGKPPVSWMDKFCRWFGDLMYGVARDDHR